MACKTRATLQQFQCLEVYALFVVTKLDRLARSTRDLLNTLAAIGEAGASFRSLGVILGQTLPLHMGRLMLTVLGGLAAMRNGRSISKLTGRNISLSFWGRSFVIPSSLAARDCIVPK